MNTDPTLKPDIAALKKRLAEDPGFAAQVTGDRPLRRNVDGVCTRSACECEREGLGDQCVWLKPVADHWSDCATNNSPAYPAGPCDCMPTPAMCRAAVVYLNGPEVYEKLPREVLDIEESIYREVWLAMQAAAPTLPPSCKTRAGVEDLQREVARLKVENARLAEETMRLQGLLTAAHQIVGELARPSGI